MSSYSRLRVWRSRTFSASHFINSLSILLLSLPPFVVAQDAIEEMEIIGIPLHGSAVEAAQPISVLGGEELRNKQASTLGETLKNEPGVHSSYFGPVASSPIIRGLDGPRVLITQNGLDVGDASRVGPDHVVSTEASTAQQIEILRGPATLFFGSGAIGGVVNVVDDRVPNNSETKAAFLVQHNTVANENEISAAYTGGNSRFAFHVDSFWRDGDDYKLPAKAEFEGDLLENSASENKGANIGGSLLLDNGYVGLSYGHLEKLNGIPGHGHEEEGVEEKVLSDLDQDRWQLISELIFNGDFLQGINSRIGYTDYVHNELEVTDEVNIGTVFNNQTLQARVDFLHQEIKGWHGAFSVDYKNTEFEALGEEAFTSPSETESVALTWLEEKHSNNFLWQFGARVENVNLQADPLTFEHAHEEDTELEILTFETLDFTPYSISAGVVWDFTPGYKISSALTHTQRAPTAAELFSLGPHIATGAYEVGALFELHEEEDEVHLDYVGEAAEEVANNIDLSLRKHQGDIGFVVSLFHNRVSDYYYERNTGYLVEDIFEHEEGEEEEEHEHSGELPVYIFEQADATFYGMEAEFNWQLVPRLKWTLWGDSVRGKLDQGGNLPRIPPLRLGNQLNFNYKQWRAELSLTHNFEQDEVAVNETLTEAYTLVDALISYQFDLKGANDGTVTLFAKVDNLTDEVARVHSSFLKDRAPLPGRGFSLGLRGRF